MGGGPSPDRLAQICRSTLERNWREGERGGVRYAYTAPSGHRYPWQWYWDSCFTRSPGGALTVRGPVPKLESLLAASRLDGFIGHTIFWAQPVSAVRSLFHNVRTRAHFMTATIQPPLLAWAWRIAVGDPAAVPALVMELVDPDPSARSSHIPMQVAT